MSVAKRRRTRLTSDQLKAFVVAWTKAQSIEDVVTATSLTRLLCISFAVRLRKLGVKLQKLSGPPHVDAAELNRLIETTLRVQNAPAPAPARTPSPAEAIAARRLQR